VLIFMRGVRSLLYFEQMKGRTGRSIPTGQLTQVTPDAKAGRDRFVDIDAVAVTESRKTVMRPLAQERTVSFDKLLDRVAEGDWRDETLNSLAARLVNLDRKLEDGDRIKVAGLAGGLDLHALADALPGRSTRIESRRRWPSGTAHLRSTRSMTRSRRS
jgi:type I restriction enzyme R subunit